MDNHLTAQEYRDTRDHFSEAIETLINNGFEPDGEAVKTLQDERDRADSLMVEQEQQQLGLNNEQQQTIV